MKVLVPVEYLTLFCCNSLGKTLQCVCSAVVMQYSLSLFCLSVAYGLLSHLSNPPLRLQSFMFLCIRFYILVLETADLVFANPKAEI